MSYVTGNDGTNNSTLLDVLLTVKQNIMYDTKVAGIYKILSIEGNDIRVTSVNSNEQLKCVKLQNLDLQINDIVLVLFTDTDFRSNLTKIRLNKQTQPVTSKVYHSSAFGVIVGLIYRQ